MKKCLILKSVKGNSLIHKKASVLCISRKRNYSAKLKMIDNSRVFKGYLFCLISKYMPNELYLNMKEIVISVGGRKGRCWKDGKLNSYATVWRLDYLTDRPKVLTPIIGCCFKLLVPPANWLSLFFRTFQGRQSADFGRNFSIFHLFSAYGTPSAVFPHTSLRNSPISAYFRRFSA